MENEKSKKVPPKLFSVKQAAELSGYNETVLRRKCAAGSVAHTRRGTGKDTRYFFTEAEVEGLLVHIEAHDEGQGGGND